MSNIYRCEGPPARGTDNRPRRGCGALVNVTTRWVYGSWDEGTGARFRAEGTIPPNTCPICRTPYPFSAMRADPTIISQLIETGRAEVER